MTELLAAAAEGAEEFSILAVPIGEVIFGLIAFLIVFGVLGKMLLPKIRTALEEREQAIEGGLRAAEKAQAESAKLMADYQDELRKAREEAGEIRAAAQAEKAQIIEAARSEAQAAAAQVTASAQAQIEAEKNRAMEDLRHSVGELATDIAAKIVGSELIDPDKARSVVDSFIDELEQAAAAKPEVV